MNQQDACLHSEGNIWQIAQTTPVTRGDDDTLRRGENDNAMMSLLVQTLDLVFCKQINSASVKLECSKSDSTT